MNKRLLILLTLIASTSYADPIMDQQEQINQALINARSKIDFNKVKEQQGQQNKDNQLAIKISEITGIPSWRNIVFIRDARDNNQINQGVLVQLLDEYLLQNRHPRLNDTQKKLIITTINEIAD